LLLLLFLCSRSLCAYLGHWWRIFSHLVKEGN
jgi:hypothetical protein